MNESMKGIRIEYHILQSFPVTCLNRDDVGAPKTAVVGGVTRARVSSQCWKRQVRLSMAEFGVKLGTRTKKVKELIYNACINSNADEVKAETCSEKLAKFLSDDTLLFISDSEIDKFVEYAKDNEFDDSKFKERDLIKTLNKSVNKSLNALDITLFGRMVAKVTDMNIEAAASFSHAISTHKVSNEVEFFTAIDDLQDKPGSAHMGSLEYNSATYYRYISLDLGQLSEMLDNDDIKEAVSVFTKALYVAIPSARQTTQSGACPWEFAKVLVRKGQRLQIPFEKPVGAEQGSYLKPSIKYLKNYLELKEKLSGESLYGKLGDYEWGENENYDIDDLISSLKNHIK